MFTVSDYVQMGIVWSLDGLAIFLNTILIFAIHTRTPKNMQSYSIFLLNNAMVDICSSITSGLGTIRIVNSHRSEIIFVSLGPCSFIDHSFCHLCHSIHSSLVAQSIVVLLLSFCYRLLIISGSSPLRAMAKNRVRIWSVCLISLVPCVAAACIFYLLGEEPPLTVQRTLGVEGYINSWLPHLRDIRAVIPLLYYSLSAPVAMVLIFFVRRRLLTRIATVTFSERNHHNRIAQALTYQMLLPSGLIIGVIVWFIDLMEISYGEWSQRSIMGIYSIFALASPVINFLYLPHYRAIFYNTMWAEISFDYKTFFQKNEDS